jgi:glycosyltransferase involved in cell wall biosynthesis
LQLEKRQAKRIIALYSLQARELASAGIQTQRITVVPFGIDLTKYDRDRLRTVPDVGIFRIGIVARMAEGKGHTGLLLAVRQLVHRYPGLRVRVIGDGPLRSRLQTLIQELELGGVVELTGWIHQDDIPSVMRTLNAIVLPTYMSGEAFPVALIEGMAMGLPAIGTRWAGIPDLIVDGVTGVLVEPNDVAGLTNAIERVVHDPLIAAEMGRCGRTRAEQLFAMQAVVEAHMTIYHEILDRNNGV